MTADMPFMSACWSSISGFPFCLWLNLVKKNSGGFCLLLGEFCAALHMKPWFHVCKCILSQSWNSKFWVDADLGSQRDSVKVQNMRVTEETILQGARDPFLPVLDSWVTALSWIFLSKRNSPYWSEIRTRTPLPEVSKNLVKYKGILLTLDNLWWVCWVHKCHTRLLAALLFYLNVFNLETDSNIL